MDSDQFSAQSEKHKYEIVAGDDPTTEESSDAPEAAAFIDKDIEDLDIIMIDIEKDFKNPNFLRIRFEFQFFQSSMRLESCSCLAGKGLFKNLDVGDEGLLTAGFEEIDNGFDFGPHASAWENS